VKEGARRVVAALAAVVVWDCGPGTLGVFMVVEGFFSPLSLQSNRVLAVFAGLGAFLARRGGISALLRSPARSLVGVANVVFLFFLLAGARSVSSPDPGSGA